MLKKLLKYDLKYMIKNMLPFYLLAIFFSLTTRIFLSVEETVIIKILYQISLGCFIAMLFNIIINTMIRSWIRFQDSIYKDEGYLTNTLPVTKKEIYYSKFLQTLIFFVIGFLIIIGTLFLAFYTKNRWIELKNIINNITTGLEFPTTLFVISFLSVIFLEILNAIQCGFFGIILGNKRNNGKTLFSVLFGFIFYLISQSMVLGLVFLVGLFNKSIMNLFTTKLLLDTSSLKLLILLSVIFYILIITLMSILGVKQLEKGINIE